MILGDLIIIKAMWCGLPMTITRSGYSKVIEQLKAKMEKRNEERNMLVKSQEGKLSSRLII